MWLAALLVLVAGGGAAAWMNSTDSGPERVAAAPAVAPAPPPARATASVPPAEAPDVSTAAILHDTSAAEDKPVPALKSAAPVKDSDSSLAAALESKPAARVDAPAAKPAKSSDDAKAARAREHRLAVREREEKQRADKHPLARKVVAKAAEKKAKQPDADNDSDVALLAALVAHSKNSQAAKPAAESADARKLRQCKALDSVAEADACRARLCGGSAKEGVKSSAACKPARAAQVVDAS